MDWILVALLCLAAAPGVAVALPGLLDAIEEQAPAGAGIPPKRVLYAAASAQALVLVAIAAIVGELAAPRVGLEAPAFRAVADGRGVWGALAPQVLPGIGLGVAGAAPFLLAYYLVVRRALDPGTVAAMERVRHRTGLLGRILYGGVVEEILARWGLTSLFAWGFSLLFGGPTPAAIWSGIVAAGLLFAVGHAPAYLAAGCRPTPAFFTAMIGLNLWASLIFGFLFWQWGLGAAILAHAAFHVVWWPLDQRRRERPSPAA